MNSKQILPYDGDVTFITDVICELESMSLYSELLSCVPWIHDEVIMFGKRITTKRKIAWYAENDLSYTYSGSKKAPFSFTPLLKDLKRKVESHLGCEFNSCLLNYYANGDESMGWHCDNERELYPDNHNKTNRIASLSLGAKRRFDFRHKISKETISLSLDSGSIVYMAGTTQQNWKHQLPKSKSVLDGRINLTFRKVFRKRIK